MRDWGPPRGFTRRLFPTPLVTAGFFPVGRRPVTMCAAGIGPAVVPTETNDDASRLSSFTLPSRISLLASRAGMDCLMPGCQRRGWRLGELREAGRERAGNCGRAVRGWTHCVGAGTGGGAFRRCGGISLLEKAGRIHYPAFGREPVRGILRNVLKLPQGSNGYFLFTGNEPLEMIVPDARVRQAIVVRPERAR